MVFELSVLHNGHLCFAAHVLCEAKPSWREIELTRKMKLPGLLRLGVPGRVPVLPK